MQPKFNIDRPKVSDDEINKHKDFDNLVKQFKEQSITKARSDKSWWKNNYIKYAAVIAGVTVICTVTYTALFNKSTKEIASNDKTTTLKDQNTKNTKSTKFINEPFEKIKVNNTSYKVDNSKGAEIKHPTGSKIKIPKSSFVNKAGEEIKGEVEILYREIHDQAEIIASGIPMRYDSAGKEFTFESAGMFEITGSQNGEPVFIKHDKPLTVEFNSTQTEDRFNQYLLDTVAKNWSYIKRDNPVLPPQQQPPNPAEAKQELKKLEQKYLPAIAAIPKRIDSVKVVYTKKIEKLEKPSQPIKPNKSAGRPQFELDVDYKEFPELSAFKNAVFEIGSESTNYKPEMKDITWSSAEIEEGPIKGKNYILVLKLRQRVEKLVVYPVLSGNDFADASKKYEEKFEKYKTLQTKRLADEAKLKAEMEAKQAAYMAQQKKLDEEYIREKIRIENQKNAEVNASISSGGFANIISRVFTISNFGIYNSDCPRPGGTLLMNPQYVDGSTPLSPHTVYLIETERNIVYNLSNGASMRINNNTKYTMCLLSGRGVYTVSKDDFESAVASKELKFKTTKLGEEITDLYSLKKAIGIGS
ncbi:MAG: cell envelope integrity protein TolA [Sphingobacteriaceae bacterium]|nr:cell envelope integrity protein TolA [Sphingobacteriaceae bacterium]